MAKSFMAIKNSGESDYDFNKELKEIRPLRFAKKKRNFVMDRDMRFIPIEQYERRVLERMEEYHRLKVESAGIMGPIFNFK